jgi:hypothetical protein
VKEDPPEWLEIAFLVIGLLPTLLSTAVAIYNELQKVKWPEIKWPW